MGNKKNNGGRTSSRRVSGGSGRPAPMTAPSGVTTEEMAKATHLLAIDKLKDEDSVFNIRHYFGV